MIELSNDEKIAAFDKIAANYYNKNFGALAKSDLEVLLFSEYIEHCIKCDANYSDYFLSKELEITQNRVRSLKEKKQLKYPHEGFDWRNGLLEALKTAKYDKKNHDVKMIIPDVNVQIEFRDYVESKGWYDEYSLNRRLSIIPISGFVDIFGDNFDLNDDVRRNIEIICANNPETVTNEIKGFLSDFSKESLKKFLMVASAEAIKLVLSAFPFGTLISPMIDIVRKAIEEA